MSLYRYSHIKVIDINDSSSFGRNHCNDNDYQHYQAYNDGYTHAFLAALMMLFCLYQLLLGTLDIVSAFCNIGFDAIDLFSLREDQSWELVEELHALIDRRFQLLNVSELVLNITYCVLESNARLAHNLLLQHILR